MDILHVLNQPTSNGHVVGDTGYAVYINYVVDEINKQGHSNQFITYPYQDYIRIQNDDVLGFNLFAICQDFDKIVIHATTPLPKKFIELLSTDHRFDVLTVVHDPVFCNTTYGKVNGHYQHHSQWGIEQRVQEPAKFFEPVDSFGISTEVPHNAMRDIYVQLMNNSKVVCPSPQVTELLIGLGIRATALHDLPHAVPDLKHLRNPNADLKKVLTIATWNKVDYQTVFNAAQQLPDYQFYLICSKRMRRVIKQIPANVELVPTMSPEDFYRYVANQAIGQCVHISKIFETFAFLPYEMAQLGVRTILPSNGSGLEKAIDANALRPCCVPLNYNTADVVQAITQDADAWSWQRAQPMTDIETYVAKFLSL